jgi:peptidoglycan/LPS O-acetylase OafA/YrhL
VGSISGDRNAATEAPRDGYGRVPALDGLRGLAFLFVFAFHAGYLTGGSIGVDIFFVLSGFLITSILLREYISTGTISFRRFYARRALRLLPALVTILVFVVAWAALFDRDRLGNTLRDASSVLFYCYNFMILDWLETHSSHEYMFIHLWSLSVEEQFYLVWPLTIAAIMLFYARQRLQAPILAIGICLPALCRAVSWKEADWFMLYARTDLRVDSLMWGAMVAWIVASKWRPRPIVARLLCWLSAAALIALFGLAKLPHAYYSGKFAFYGGYSLVAICSAVIIASAAFGLLPFIVRVFLEYRPLCFVGIVSYAAYLWHHPLNVVVGATGYGAWWPWIGLPITLLVAGLSFYFVELPFLRLRNAFPLSREAAAAL